MKRTESPNPIVTGGPDPRHLTAPGPTRRQLRAVALHMTAFAALTSWIAACAPPLPEASAPTAAPPPVVEGPVELGGARLVEIGGSSLAALGAYGTQNLPAYRTAAEVRAPGARDQSDDYRNANPQYFAATVPPTPGRYRPYGEWETVGEVWTTYSSGMPGTPAVRRMFAEQTIAFLRYSKPVAKAYVVVNNTSLASDFGKAVDSYGITGAEKQNLTYVTLPNQTIWMMDYSGFPLVDKQTGALAFVDWNYYQPRHLDDALGVRIPHEVYGATVYRVGFPFEGGNFQSDGVGRCMTSNRALANTGYSALKVRSLLSRYAGCETTYIVKDVSDDGTGHIDMFFKWVDTSTVLFGEYRDSIDADVNGDGKIETVPMPGKVAPDYAQTFALNKQRMEDNVALFQGQKASDGQLFKTPRLPMMTRFKDQYGDVPRTFINSTFANGVNVYPSYAASSCQSPNGALCKIDADCGKSQHCAAGRCTPGPAAEGCDEIVTCGSGLVCKPDGLKIALTKLAQAEWQKAMPTYTHVGLRADTIALWSGAIHCITRTVPLAKSAKAFADGTCVKGSCACSEGGSEGVCSTSAACFGPALLCNCNICKGSCSSGKSCTDDADCSPDGKTTVAGSCKFTANQGCYGAPPLGGGGGSSGGSSGGCGDVSFEGSCNGKMLSYCDKGLQNQTCSGCCAWDSQSGYYNCLSGTACNGCVQECVAGSGGCSSQGTHAWACSVVGGCAMRVWTACASGCDAATGTCKAGSSSDACPPSPDAGGTDADAGSTDTGSADTGSADTASADTASADTGNADTGSADTGNADTDSADTGSADTGSADTGSADTASADTGGADTGSADTGVGDTNGSCIPQCTGKSCGGDGCGGVCGVCQGTSVCGPAFFCIGADDAGTLPQDDGEAGRGGDGNSASDGVGAPDGVTTTGTGYVLAPAPSSMCTSAPQAGSSPQAGWLAAVAAGLLLWLRRRQAVA